MTMTLAHPAAEDLGRFVDGTLDDAGRASVVAHIADCDECRIMVLDAAEFVEPAVAHSDRRWWVAIAATIVLVAAVGTFTYSRYHDPLAKVSDAYVQLSKRPIEGRLSGFPFVPWSANRGKSDETDAPLMILQWKAASVTELRGKDGKTLHARGVAHLLSGDAETATVELSQAANAEPANARYWNDLAVAQIAARRPEAALSAAERSLAIPPPLQDALFNRALALEALGRRGEAHQAFDQYLATDRTSPWAAEAQAGFERTEP
jgi:tetratricopeptide (TPR) repeat protein